MWPIFCLPLTSLLVLPWLVGGCHFSGMLGCPLGGEQQFPAVGSLGAWQSGRSFGSEMKEIQERTENKKTS